MKTPCVLLLSAAASLVSAVSLSPSLLRRSADESVSVLVQMDDILNFEISQTIPDDIRSDRSALGWYVVGELNKHAQKTQQELRQELQRLIDAKEITYWKSYPITNTVVVDGTLRAIQTLAQLQGIRSVKPNDIVRTQLPEPSDREGQDDDDMENGFLWSLDLVKTPAVWSSGYKGESMIYANADTGVDHTHPELRDNYLGYNPADGTYNHNYAWWDGVRRPIVGTSPCGVASNVPCDDNGHGTHTASTSVGKTVGVAPNSKWMACRNMDHGEGRPETYLSCLNFFLAPHDLEGNNANPDARPHVIGNSYGCPSSEKCDRDTFETALANLRSAGIFMSVSAGNEGPRCSTVLSPPALSPQIMNVAALSRSKSIASFSSRGPVVGRSIGVDIAAPGVNVRGAYLRNTYRNLSGTSMASPHLAGAVLLLGQACPAYARDTLKLQKLIQDTAEPLYTTLGCGGDTSTTMPNNVFGYGLLDISAALKACTASAAE